MTRTAEALKSETETVVMLPVANCHKSPSQPRRRTATKPDAEFVASIKQKGVIQPIVVRKRKAGGWEIVFGHRRHTGSVLAGREAIPAIVREMTDDEVFEAQLVENIHREDMHPLDEADGFKRMLDRGRTPQQIADKIGRNVSYVAQRLKLCEMGEEVREALDKEKISLGVAVMLARVPLSLQAEALRSIGLYWSAPQVKEELERQFLLRLDQAPFDVGDAKLVEKAGACTVCPKRTGQQRELFPDAARKDMCTDRVCYRGKMDAVWLVRKKEAEAGGKAVLEGKAATAALNYGGAFRKLDDEEWVGQKRKTVRSLFGKDLPPVTLARDERSGAVVEVVKRADVYKVLKRSPSRVPTRSDGEKRQEEARRRRGVAVDLAIAAVVERGHKLSEAQLLRPLVHALVERSWNDTQMAVSRRRGLEKEKKTGAGVEQRLLAHLRTLKKPTDVAGFGLELALRAVAPGKWGPAKPVWNETLKALGVDFAALERQVAADAKVKKAAKKKPEKKRAA